MIERPLTAHLIGGHLDGETVQTVDPPCSKIECIGMEGGIHDLGEDMFGDRNWKLDLRGEEP